MSRISVNQYCLQGDENYDFEGFKTKWNQMTGEFE